MNPAKEADVGDSKPRDARSAFTVCLLLSQGCTQAKAAEASGVSERTIRTWVSAPWWHRLEALVAKSLGKSLMLTVRARILKQVVDEGNDGWHAARWVAERIDPLFMEPSLREVHYKLVAEYGEDYADAYAKDFGAGAMEAIDADERVILELNEDQLFEAPFDYVKEREEYHGSGES